MNNLSDIATVKEILTRHGFRFSKSLGQNFLINPTVCPRMAEMGGGRVRGWRALEVGPGIGVLTRELAARCDKVVTIELDKRLLPVLGENPRGFFQRDGGAGRRDEAGPGGAVPAGICRTGCDCVRQFAILYYVPGDHALFGRAAAHSQPDGDGAKGSGPAAVCPAG